MVCASDHSFCLGCCTEPEAADPWLLADTTALPLADKGAQDDDGHVRANGQQQPQDEQDMSHVIMELAMAKMTIAEMEEEKLRCFLAAGISLLSVSCLCGDEGGLSLLACLQVEEGPVQVQGEVHGCGSQDDKVGD